MKGEWLELEGSLPAADAYFVHRGLGALTGGQGALEVELDHYQPVRGAPPSRGHTGHNPFNRKEYLLHVLRRV